MLIILISFKCIISRFKLVWFQFAKLYSDKLPSLYCSSAITNMTQRCRRAKVPSNTKKCSLACYTRYLPMPSLLLKSVALLSYGMIQF